MRVGLAMGVAVLGCKGGAAAQADCLKPTNAFDVGYFKLQQFDAADAALNAAYQSAYERSADREALRLSELAWIRQRDTVCAARLGHDIFISFSCATRLTEQRIAELQRGDSH